ITLKTHGVRRAGSAALDLCNVAAGRYDGFWEFNLNPWDTAAGVLMVEEAGGQVTGFNGEPFQIASRETLASNGRVHEALVRDVVDYVDNDVDPDKWINSLLMQVASGRYEPMTPTRFTLGKSLGFSRTMTLPAVPDLVLYRTIVDYVYGKAGRKEHAHVYFRR